MMSENGHISVGPWGGQNGARWDDGVHSCVRQVVISHGAGIDSIQIEYDNKGCSVWSDKHGGTSGLKTAKIKFDYPDEFLVSISGHCGSFVEFGPVLVRSLVFESNRNKYGPFGIPQGTHFSFPTAGGKVVGFHGRSSWYLDSIGVYLKPFLQQTPSNKVPATPNHAITTEITKGFDMVLADENEDNHFVSNQFFHERRMEKVMVVPAVKGSVNPRQAVPYRPWGGNGGTAFDDGIYTGVREIHLTRFGSIVSIKVCYDLNGQAIWANKNGGTAGIRIDKIAFDYPSEILTHISGYYGSTILRGPTVVKSLTFHTNKRKYGPFGDEQGISFTSGSNNGIIVGFHGRKGWFIDSIGVHVLEGKPQLSQPAFDSFNMSALKISEVAPAKTVKETPQPSRTAYDSFNISDSKFCEVKPNEMVKEPVTYGSGPWGGDRGKPWDDGVFSGVKKIFLTKGEAIYCIQIEYDRNGQSLWSGRHGGGCEGNSHMIKFEYPDEILTSVCGYYGSFTGDECGKIIKSLTFYTNKGKYGPYGEETGTFFTSKKTEGKIVGFHGRSGCYLNTVGVHMQH